MVSLWSSQFFNFVRQACLKVSSKFVFVGTAMFILICSISVPLYEVLIHRSTHWEVFLRKGVLKICSKFTGENPCRSAISIKLLCNIIEITLRHGCSPVNWLHISRTRFQQNTSEWLILNSQLKVFLWVFLQVSDCIATWAFTSLFIRWTTPWGTVLSCPKCPFYEFRKVFLEILFAYPLRPLFPCLFVLTFLMTFGNRRFYSLSFVHESTEEDHQVLYALGSYPRNIPLYFF